ncbi:MAG: TetR/AcrR family transcriptional regulator [Reyranellaceae bacterium]
MARPRRRWNGAFEPSNDDHDLKRRLLLREAGAAFSERGFHNVSLDQVALRLGVSKTVCYYYFKDKNHLLLSCIEIGFQLADQALDTAEATEGTALDKVVAFTRAYVGNITSELGTCAVLTDLQSLAEADLKAVQARQRQFSRRLIRLIKLGLEDGSIQVSDPRVAVSWIVSGPLMIPKLSHLWQSQGTAWLADHYAEFTRRSLSAR